MPLVEIAGVTRSVSHAFGSLRDCAYCRAAFTVTSITGRQSYCSESCKEKAAWRRDRSRPEIVLANRERCKRWAANNRSVGAAGNAWLLGAPAHAEFLPGGAFPLTISPVPRWAIELRNTRALHGLVTTLIGRPHEAGAPGFALIPSTRAACGWGVYVPDGAHELANRTRDGMLFDKAVAVTTGPLFRLKAPTVTKRGRRRLRIDCLTPVVIRSQGGAVRHVRPHASNLLSTLATWTPQRLGVTIGPTDATMVLVERGTHAEWTQMGGKYGATAGFTGHLIVECNAVSEWLLRCCETIGFGGKTAFGFGRIKVSDA